MTLLLIVYRSLRQHAFSTAITAASLALAGGLLMTVWMVKAQAQRSFLRTSPTADLPPPQWMCWRSRIEAPLAIAIPCAPLSLRLARTR